MLAEKFLQQERFAGASQSCDYLDESVAFGTAQLVIYLSLSIIMLYQFMSHVTLFGKQSYIFFL